MDNQQKSSLSVALAEQATALRAAADALKTPVNGNEPAKRRMIQLVTSNDIREAFRANLAKGFNNNE